MSYGDDEATAGETAHELVVELARIAGLFAEPEDLARAVTGYLAPTHPAQAAAIAACWWQGLDVGTLAALVEARRFDTIKALWSPPIAARRWRGYAEAGRVLHRAAPTVRKSVQRGLRNLLAWQYARAERLQTSVKLYEVL